MILLESFHQDDWLKIAAESDGGYAIIIYGEMDPRTRRRKLGMLLMKAKRQ